MRYRVLDINGDYSFGRGQQNITYGKYAVAQAVETRLKLLKGEWWENTEEGLPLFQRILGTSGALNNLIIIDSLIKERIIKTPGVLAIKNFESTFENRKYSFYCNIETQYGDIEIDENL
ncbi:hypothetical protein [Clostridium ihumii]|uniref:hypothetical protein n=1 Tax=Clostridium ihumii TaxID=1470356 RepID=UPI00055946A3|nr:hypothetical protein [Clostridium ihumii]